MPSIGMHSLGARLLLIASLLLAAFLGLTGAVLERAYVENAESSRRERLQVHAYTLIAAAEQTASGAVQIVYPVSELRFFMTGSGLYARIVRNDGAHLWTSPSMAGMDIPFPRGLARMDGRFDTLHLADGTELGAFSIGMGWQAELPRNRLFTVSVAEDLSAYQTELAGFRRKLWSWLGVLALVLLAVQWSVLRWGLAPLRRIAADLLLIENGRKAELDGRYPAELQRLSTNLNALVHNERERRERYRRALGDLAHSLKTPLAILRGGAEGKGDAGELRATMQTQVDRMSQIVDHQLRRAATGGPSVLGAAAVSPLGVARKVVDALDKAYAGKRVTCTIDADEDARFRGDEEDLYEILGNLLDNAYKWCGERVALELRSRVDDGEGRRLEIVVDDDGPGVAEDAAARIFERGARAGDGPGGHGIGLAMVRDIAAVYGGSTAVTRGGFGGARVTVVL